MTRARTLEGSRPLIESKPDGLVAAYLLDSTGGGKEIGWPAIASWGPEQGLLWVHLDLNEENARSCARVGSGLNPPI